MRPDSRSVSFTFHREVLSVRNSPEMMRSSRNLRQRLQDRFEKDRGSSSNDTKEKPPKTKESTDRAWNNISLGNVSADSRRALRNGAEKLSRTISSVRTTFGTISQVRWIKIYDNKLTRTGFYFLFTWIVINFQPQILLSFIHPYLMFSNNNSTYLVYW